MSLIARIRFLAILTMFAGVLALAAIALQGSIILVTTMACFTVIGSYGVLTLILKLRRSVEQSSAMIASFIRGGMDSRILSIGRLDEIGRLQHRINNLFDIIDLHARGDESAVNAGDDEAYLAKIQESGLYETLQESGDGAETSNTSAAAGGFLRELRDSVQELLKTDENKEVSGDVLRKQREQVQALLQQTRVVGQQFQRIMHLLDQAREQLLKPTPVPTSAVTTTRPQASIRPLERQLVQLAEQIGLLSLNAAIEAGRAGDAGQGFAAVAGEIKMLGSKIERVAHEIGREATTFETAWNIVPKPITDAPAIRMPESFEVAIASLHEQADRLALISRMIEQLGDSASVAVSEAA